MSNVSLVIGGLVLFVAGLILAGIVAGIASSTGSAATLGSFAGSKEINDFIPTAFYIGLMVGGLGSMGLGAARAAGFGRRRGNR